MLAEVFWMSVITSQCAGHDVVCFHPFSVSQAWWISDTVSTDVWGRWELLNSMWHYTNLKNYPEGNIHILDADLKRNQTRNTPMSWKPAAVIVSLNPPWSFDGSLPCLMRAICVFGPCFVPDYLQAIQATSVLACVFAILALFVFVAQLFTLAKGQRFTFTGVLQFLSCKFQKEWPVTERTRRVDVTWRPSPFPPGLCIMIAASIYTAKLHTSEAVGGYGHCYVLAWISFVLTFVLSITYLVLRKKSEWHERREGSPGSCFQFEFGIVNRVPYKLWKKKMLRRAILFAFSIHCHRKGSLIDISWLCKVKDKRVMVIKKNKNDFMSMFKT